MGIGGERDSKIYWKMGIGGERNEVLGTLRTICTFYLFKSGI